MELAAAVNARRLGRPAISSLEPWQRPARAAGQQTRRSAGSPAAKHVKHANRDTLDERARHANSTMDGHDSDRLSLSDSDSDALFATPAAKSGQPPAHDDPAKAARPKESWSTKEEREAALRKELESVRNVNKVIEGVVESLEKAKSNMSVRGAAHAALCGMVC